MLLIAIDNEFNRYHYPSLINTIYNDRETVASYVNLRELTIDERRHRMNIRNFMLTHTFDELHTELQIAFDKNDLFRCSCIKELLNECEE